MVYWPMLLWWLCGYFINKKGRDISPSKWFLSCAVAQLVCPMVIMVFFYAYTGAFGIESLLFDIFLLLLGLASAQLLALHIYQWSKPAYYVLYCAVIVLALLAAAFTFFTFEPPNIPLFIDSPIS